MAVMARLCSWWIKMGYTEEFGEFRALRLKSSRQGLGPIERAHGGEKCREFPPKPSELPRHRQQSGPETFGIFRKSLSLQFCHVARCRGCQRVGLLAAGLEAIAVRKRLTLGDRQIRGDAQHAIQMN